MALTMATCSGDTGNMSAFDMSTLADILQSAVGTKALQDEARQAADRVRTIDERFHGFRQDLERFDSLQFDASLIPKLECIYEKFCGIRKQSQRYAVKIAGYCQNFGGIIVPLCMNSSTISMDKRRAEVQRYIQIANSFEADSEQIVSQLNEIKRDFESFTESLRQWAAEHQQTQGDHLDRLDANLTELKRQIENDTHASDYSSASFEFGGLYKMAAISLFAASFCALRAFPDAIPVLPSLGELLLHGSRSLGFGAMVTRAAEGNEERLIEQTALNEQILQQRSYLTSIIDTRNELVRIGDHEAMTFSAAILAVKGIWCRAQRDAVALSNELETNFDHDQIMPIDIVKRYLEASSRIYTAMAYYLHEYALALAMI